MSLLIFTRNPILSRKLIIINKISSSDFGIHKPQVNGWKVEKSLLKIMIASKWDGNLIETFYLKYFIKILFQDKNFISLARVLFFHTKVHIHCRCKIGNHKEQFCRSLTTRPFSAFKSFWNKVKRCFEILSPYLQ